MENEVKEPAPKYHFISPDEYLAIERASPEKHEYYDGHMVAMSGARMKHVQIASNLNSEIGTFLKDKECQFLPSDMKVSVPGRTAYMYPDGSILCGEAKLEDDQMDTLLNSSVIFEILSPSTQKYDAGYKMTFYKQIPALKEYFLIDSAKRFAQVVRRQPDRAWLVEDINGPNGELFIQTINFHVSFDDVYRNTSL